MSLHWQRNRRFSEFSTFGIGGPILLFAVISSLEEMEEAFVFSERHKIPFFILGKGSNCLFDDAGFNGIVLLNRIDLISFSGAVVLAGAGTSYSLLGHRTTQKGLRGLEFASGIPASVGGAVYMNAGANGWETCDRLQTVLYLERTGKRREFKREELSFGYRTSPFQKMEGAIIFASFGLERGDGARQRQRDLMALRMKTQPLKELSAGCVFRNPDSTVSAGALIDRCGLKGFRVGDAAVSELHANFLVNRGKATSMDVQSLIAIVQTQVFQKTGVHLEPEIKIIGSDYGRR